MTRQMPAATRATDLTASIVRDWLRAGDSPIALDAWRLDLNGPT
jgi:hypothetical protein